MAFRNSDLERINSRNSAHASGAAGSLGSPAPLRGYGSHKWDPQLGPLSASIAIESLKILQNLVQRFDPGGEGLQRGARRTPSSSPVPRGYVACLTTTNQHCRLRIAADTQTRTPQLATCQHHCLAGAELMCTCCCKSRAWTRVDRLTSWRPEGRAVEVSRAREGAMKYSLP